MTSTPAMAPVCLWRLTFQIEFLPVLLILFVLTIDSLPVLIALLVLAVTPVLLPGLLALVTKETSLVTGVSVAHLGYEKVRTE